MTRQQYEQHKQKLEEQHRAGVQLLENAYQAQVRALELVWMLQAEAEGGPRSVTHPEAAPSSTSQSRRRRGVGELEDDIRAALPSLPELLTHREIRDAVGGEPDRGSVYRILQDLTREGSLRVESVGEGRNPTVYRQTGALDHPGGG